MAKVWTNLKHEKLQTPKSLLLFTEMDASLVAPRTSNPLHSSNISDLA